MNKQPFYHSLCVLFTATADVSIRCYSRTFRDKLARFLREELGKEVVGRSVEVEEANAEAGDPADLL